jgi:hypothetical protein
MLRSRVLLYGDIESAKEVQPTKKNVLAMTINRPPRPILPYLAVRLYDCTAYSSDDGRSSRVGTNAGAGE